jgi:hypothetical protein
MATASLVGRLARLEGRLGAAALRWMAARNGATGAEAAELAAELRTFWRLVSLRLGPRPDRRALARLLAERYEADEERVYATLVAAEERRTG